MRFAILVKSTEASEAGEMPGEDSLVDVVTYHEELARAGALYDATGLHPTREGWRIRYSRGTRTVVDGPFAGGNAQVAGWTTERSRCVNSSSSRTSSRGPRSSDSVPSDRSNGSPSTWSTTAPTSPP